MFGYECAKCSQKRLITVQYPASRKENNTAAGGVQDTDCNLVKPTQLPGIQTFLRPGYPIYINKCDNSVQVDTNCGKNTKSTTNDSTVKGSPLMKYISQDNLSAPQQDDIAAHGSRNASEDHAVCITCRQPLREQHHGRNGIPTRVKAYSSYAHGETLPKQATECKQNCARKEEDYHNCDQMFVQRGNLLFHNDKTYFTCLTCARIFPTKRMLTTHIRIHTGDKPYSCKTCHKSFSQQSTLTVHIRIHTGEKPYVCTICGKRYGHNSTLIRHKKSQH